MKNTSAKRILLIADECHTGEALRIAPYVRAIRERHPDASMVLLANEHAAAAFGHGELFHKVVISRIYGQQYASGWALRRHQASEILRLIRQIGSGYDLVITFWWGTTLLNVIGLLAAPLGRRIGYARRLPFLLTSTLGIFSGDQTLAHIALLRAAGIDVPKLPPALDYDNRDVAAIERRLAEHGLGGSRGLVILHPGSDWACQQWLRGRWAQLADEIASRYEADLIFTGVRGEAAYIDEIRSRMRVPSLSLAGQTTLTELVALLARARLCVCVDSAVFELTQAIGLPAVVLAGPTGPQDVVPGRRLPVIVNVMPPERRIAINDCKVAVNEVGQHRYLEGGCLNYACPMSGLREISVSEAMRAVEEQARQAGLAERVPA